jgi:hypothetical protein
MAYRKFSDAIRENPICPEPEPGERLAGLATLAGIRAADRVSPSSIRECSEEVPGSIGGVLENGDETAEAAKSAKIAKDEGGAAAAWASRCGPFGAVQLDGGNEPQSEPQLISPVSWMERYGPPALGEPPYDQPCLARRGQVKREGAAFLHFCVNCGAWGAFGYDVFGDRRGRWYCSEHRPSS